MLELFILFGTRCTLVSSCCVTTVLLHSAHIVLSFSNHSEHLKRINIKIFLFGIETSNKDQTGVALQNSMYFLYNLFGGNKVAVSIILAWIIGFGYTFSYSLGINKVLDGHCLVYYIPDEIWRKVLFFLASADS